MGREAMAAGLLAVCDGEEVRAWLVTPAALAVATVFGAGANGPNSSSWLA